MKSKYCHDKTDFNSKTASQKTPSGDRSRNSKTKPIKGRFGKGARIKK